MQKLIFRICNIICEAIFHIQNSDVMCIFCIFCIRMHYPLCWCWLGSGAWPLTAAWQLTGRLLRRSSCDSAAGWVTVTESGKSSKFQLYTTTTGSQAPASMSEYQCVTNDTGQAWATVMAVTVSWCHFPARPGTRRAMPGPGPARLPVGGRRTSGIVIAVLWLLVTESQAASGTLRY
jgi:hypothetical protein